MKSHRFCASIMLFFACVPGALCQEAEEDIDLHWDRAVVEAAAVNAVLFSFNRLVTNMDYAQVSPETIRTNLASPWVWDQDDFPVNQIGHPYQGSYYFIAGRAGGLSFWSSAVLSMAGSASWELFCECETPSRNDLVSTTLGGAALGEMFHRLYRAVAAPRAPFAAVVSPLDALNRTPRLGERGPDLRYSLALGGGLLLTAPPERMPAIPAGAGAGLALEYGDPYGRDSRIPFSSFEQDWTVLGTPESFDIRFLSDGFLRSWALRDDLGERTSAGISLHYDFVYGSGFNFAGHSIGATLKHESGSRGVPFLDLKAHLNWLVFGASDNTPLRELYEEEPPVTESRDYDMGTGVSLKLALRISDPSLGSLALAAYRAGLFLFPASVPAGASGGSVWIDMVRAAYEYGLSKSIFVGGFLGLYRKSAHYSSSPIQTEMEADAGLFVKRVFYRSRAPRGPLYAGAGGDSESGS